MQNEGCRTDLAVTPLPAGSHRRDRFSWRFRSWGEGIRDFAQRNRKNLGHAGQAPGAPFFQKVSIARTHTCLTPAQDCHLPRLLPYIKGSTICTPAGSK